MIFILDILIIRNMTYHDGGGHWSFFSRFFLKLNTVICRFILKSTRFSICRFSSDFEIYPFFLASFRKQEKHGSFSIINYFDDFFHLPFYFQTYPFFSFAVFFAVQKKNGKFFIYRFFWQKRLKNDQWSGIQILVPKKNELCFLMGTN